jgi:hypothetical protein
LDYDEEDWVPTQRLLDLVAERREKSEQAGDEADEDGLAG